MIPAILETNVNELWEQEQDLDQPATQDAGQDAQLESLAGVSSASSALDAQHSFANIEHKVFVALFIPSHRLVAILQALQMLPNDPLVQSSCKLSNKRHRKKQKVYI